MQSLLNSLGYAKRKNGDYDIQYWIQMDEAIGDKYVDFIRELNLMNTYYIDLKNAYEHHRIVTKEVEAVTVDEDGNEVIEKQSVEVDEKDVDLGEGYGTVEEAYHAAIAEIEKRNQALPEKDIYKISEDMEVISTKAVAAGKTSTRDVAAELLDISEKIAEYKKLLNDGDSLLERIQGHYKDLKKAVAEYDTEYEEWKEQVNKYKHLAKDKNIIETDLYEIAVLEKEKELTAQDEQNGLERVKIDTTEVDICEKRVNAVRALVGTYIDSMDTFTYSGKKLEAISTYSDFKKNSKVEEEKIVIQESDLDTYAKTSFEAIFTKPDANNYHNITDNNNPNFMKNRPVFHEWLYMKFKDLKDGEKADDVLEDIEKQMKEEKEKQEKEDDNSDISTNDIKKDKNQKELPSDGGGRSLLPGPDKDKEEVDAACDITGLFGELDLTHILTSGRDRLYAMSYIMGMFSYDTYVKENKYKLARTGDGTKEAPSDIYKDNAGSKLDNITYKDIYSQYTEQWKCEDTTFTANKTLTNKMQNVTNNFAFGNEVEYIIYGGSNAGNKAASYGTIFGIRYAMNIGPVFRFYWNNKTVISIASSISAATSGIIPVSLIKLVICLGMTAAETAVDISYLKAGLPVLFLKTKDDLFLLLSFEELAEGATELIGGMKPNESKLESKGLSLSYSDYLTLFLFIAICADEQTIYLRTADVIQCNMQQRRDGYLMSSANAYYELNANIKVKPMMLGTPWSRQNGSSILLLFAMTGCGGNGNDGNVDNTDEPVVNVPENEPDTEPVEEETQEPIAEGTVSVAEDFTYTEENGEITITGYNGEANILQIPDTIEGKPVTTIGESAFTESNGDNIVEVIIPDSVITVGKSAFKMCSNLTKVTFGKNVQVIDASAFFNDHALESAVLPDSLVTLGTDVFLGTALTEIVIPPFVTDISNGAFALTKIETLTVPGTVKKIDDMAFQHCNNLKTVIIEEGVEAIGDEAFGQCESLESITFPNSAVEVNEYVVSNSIPESGKLIINVKAGSTAEKILGEKYKDSEKFVVVSQ